METKRIYLTDLEEIAEIYKDVVENMIVNNILQWDELYPCKDIIREDIIKEQMYAGIINNKIVSVSVFVLNKEFDKEYLEAQWEYKNDKFIILHRICVKVKYQNNGIGTKTVEMIEDNMKKKGIKSIRLDAYSKNPYSLKMYKKLGYKKVGEADWRKGLFYIFEKVI
ncbi:MAG: GNAT family N-acetyltransferase [Treponema sp.]|jgi:GNAT superfamily N-acetyltransferase|nr:GNAT family N-acetyltransferase [Treponema sp.]